MEEDSALPLACRGRFRAIGALTIRIDEHFANWVALPHGTAEFLDSPSHWRGQVGEIALKPVNVFWQGVSMTANLWSGAPAGRDSRQRAILYDQCEP